MSLSSNIALAKKLCIVRYSGDTYPERITVKMNHVLADITGWSVIMKFHEIETDDTGYETVIAGSTRYIKCLISSDTNSEILVYPFAFDTEELASQARFSDFSDGETGNGASNKCWETDGDFRYKIYRYKKENEYVERHTHYVGSLQIVDPMKIDECDNYSISGRE